MNSSQTTYRRVLGVATAAYGATLIARPRALTGPARLAETPRTTTLARVIGARDVLSGLAMTLAGPQHAGAAVTARVLADSSDVVLFGTICPGPTKAKAVAIAAGYGLLCSLAHPRVR